MNTAEILALKFPKANFIDDIGLRDQGNGIEIYLWNMGDIPKPTQEDLDRWEIELAPVKLLQDARQNRRNNYPAIGDQLDMLYKAMDTGVLTKVDDFYNSIKAVKEQFPVNE